MSSTPQPTTSANAKPSLQGVKNKQRKGVQKAQAKFEPTVFRDQLLRHLESVPPPESDSDQDRYAYFDAVSRKLDELGNSALEYRKYEQQLFSLLLVSRLLAPGGDYVEDGANPSPFSLFRSAREPVDVKDVGRVVDVFHKLIRRYKYLQKPFEESSLRAIIQYSNKFTEVELEKLATATALFVSLGLANAAVLSSLKMSHLAQKGPSIAFLTIYMRAYLSRESIDHLASSLRRTGNAELADFFPSSKRSARDVIAHFNKEGLKPVAELYEKQKANQVREETTNNLKEMLDNEDPNEEILAHLKQQKAERNLSETDLVSVLWDGVVHQIDLNNRPEQVGDDILKTITSRAEVLETLIESAKAQITLINTVQVWCHQNTKVMNVFPKVLKLLYGKDVISEQAIVYWHSKGSKPQARQAFIAMADPLVKFLQEQESDSEEE